MGKIGNIVTVLVLTAATAYMGVEAVKGWNGKHAKREAYFRELPVETVKTQIYGNLTATYNAITRGIPYGEPVPSRDEVVKHALAFNPSLTKSDLEGKIGSPEISEIDFPDYNGMCDNGRFCSEGDN